ncbi:MAG: phosphoribosylformylglycinamidine synthase subunit PurS [Candidatus Sumerlaeia bacterium]
MPTFQADITVTLKPEILDVQGRTVMEAVHQLARDEVRAVRCGKLFVLMIEAPSETAAREIAAEIAHKLLANPVIEQFQISIKEL